jgi:hypothetical protein
MTADSDDVELRHQGESLELQSKSQSTTVAVNVTNFYT